MDWFQIGIGVCRGCRLSPCLFNLYAEYLKGNAEMDESQAELKIARRNINNLRYADDTTLMVVKRWKWRGTKEPLDECERGEWKSWFKTQHSPPNMVVKRWKWRGTKELVEESEKAGLKLNIQKMKIMASGPNTSRQIDGETMETVTDFIFLGSKITADAECSHEIKRHLLLGRKAMTNLDSVLRAGTLLCWQTMLTDVCIVKAMVFPVVMYGCESWTIKKAEHQRIDAFELWCWRRLLRVPCSSLQGDPTSQS